jgi:hypothetical protein
VGGGWHLLTFDQLRELTDEQLTGMINERLHPNAIGPFVAQPADFMAAQFYLAELNRRENERANAERDRMDKRRWWTDFWLELLIVVLIGMEIALSVHGMRQQSREATKEVAAFGRIEEVLAGLEKTSEETAGTMGALEATSQHMSAILQKQVELFYDVQINVVYSVGAKKLTISNLGRSNVTLWSARIGTEAQPMVKYPKPVLIPPSGAYEIGVQDLVKSATSLVPKGQKRPYIYTFWVRNERGEKFTVSGDLLAQWGQNAISFTVPDNTIIAGWSKP